MTDTFTVDLCHDWVRIGEVADPKFNGVERLLDVGEWSLTTSPQMVSFGTHLDGVNVVEWTPNEVNTVRLVRGNTIEYAGYVRPVSDGAGGWEQVFDDKGEHWTWSGPDLWDILRRRIAYPTPATEPPWVDTHDTNTGVASTVLTNYLLDNMGSGALADRQITGLVVADQVVGISDTWTARLQPLDELVKRICGDADLTCRITVDFDGQITITIGQGRDLSDRYIVSDDGDQSLLKVRHATRTVSTVIAGGPGTGVSRTFRSSDAGVTGADRREVFLDQSSLNSATELAAAAQTARWLGSGTYSVYVELTDSAATAMRYGRDFVVGDSLAVQVDLVRFVVPVTAAAFEIDDRRQVVRPILGTAIPDSLRGLMHRLDVEANRSTNSIA